MRGSIAAALLTAALVTLTGCGTGGQGQARSSHTPPAGSSAASLTAKQLSGALLKTYDGWGALTEPTNGTYASLPTSDIGKVPDPKSPPTVSPAKCARAAWSGPSQAQFGRQPATVVTLAKPGDTSGSDIQVWDELIAVNGQQPRAALGNGPQPGCGKLTVHSDSGTMAFTELKVPSVGTGTRGAAVDFKIKGSRKTQVITFTAARYIGVVLVQGPMKKSDLDGFVTACYQQAHQILG